MTRTTIGKYIDLELIGQGGMAEVYIGVDPTLNRKVAIKLILPHFADKSDFEARFQREAETVASLRHANIVQIYEYSIEDGTPFMVMEYLAGGSLDDKLKAYEEAGKTMPLDEAATILDKVCSGLDYAHDRGLIHRDIKPANILFSEDGEPIIADFGIVKLLDMDSSSILTQTGSVVGSPRYLPPEQATSQEIDKRSDIYSLGIVLYQMVTGEVPFDGDMLSVMMQHVNERPENPVTINADLPVGTADVILKALEKDPQYRFDSAGDMAKAFRASLANPIAPAMVATPVATTHAETKIAEAKETVVSEQPATSNSKMMIIGGIVGILILALLAFAVFGGGFGGATEEATATDSPIATEVDAEPSNDETVITNVEPTIEPTAILEEAELVEEDTAVPEPTPTEEEPAPTAVVIDTTTPRGDIVINGSTITATLNDLDPAEEGFNYVAWLTEPESAPLQLGTIDGEAGDIIFSDPDANDILESFSGFVITEEPESDGEPTFSGPIIYEAQIEEQIIADYRHLQDVLGIPLAQALSKNMVAQARSFTDHTGFGLTDILTNGNLVGGKNHAEHTINIASGTASDDYFDWDGNGRPENPGDDVGLLTYVRLLATVAAASDKDLAEQINELISEIENHVSLMTKITASDTLEEATTRAETLDTQQGQIMERLLGLLAETEELNFDTHFEVFATGN